MFIWDTIYRQSSQYDRWRQCVGTVENGTYTDFLIKMYFCLKQCMTLDNFFVHGMIVNYLQQNSRLASATDIL